MARWPTKSNGQPAATSEVLLLALMGGSIHTPGEIEEAVGEFL